MIAAQISVLLDGDDERNLSLHRLALAVASIGPRGNGNLVVISEQMVRTLEADIKALDHLRIEVRRVGLVGTPSRFGAVAIEMFAQ